MKNETKRLLKRAKQIVGEGSMLFVLRRGFDKIFVYLNTPFKKRSLQKKEFNVFGKSYEYFVHSYNATYRNERAVEIAIAINFLNTHKDKRILEIGNVMSYYSTHSHEVIDKYEKSPGVKNIDIIDFKVKEKYDAIIAISTFEHIGWDEPEKNPEKFDLAIQHLKKLVLNNEEVLVTVPLGYNPHIDNLVRSNQLPFEKYVVMKRDKKNNWVECSPLEGVELVYGSTYRAANALLIGKGLID